MNGDHAIEFECQINDNADQVHFFTVDHPSDNTSEISLIQNGFHAVETLHKSIAENKNWEPSNGKDCTTEEFKNESGQVALKRSFDEFETLETCCAHDRFVNLTHALPPLVDLQDGVLSDESEKLCHQCKCDDTN